MIARLQGILENKGASSVVLMTGGVGYEVFIPLTTFYDLPELGEEVRLHIKTIVREDALELFGFLSPVEKDAFQLLNSVSKIGPRLALAILSGINPPELVDAITTKNLGRLSSIPGVGKKTAERLVMELKDKIIKLEVQPLPSKMREISSPQEDPISTDAVSALLNLGYQRSEAENTVAAVLDEVEEAHRDLSDIIRRSLKKLQKV